MCLRDQSLHFSADIPACLIQQTPVEWKKVCCLQPGPEPSPYIDYKELIMQNRTPALFPDSCQGIGFEVVSSEHYIKLYSTDSSWASL